MQEAIDKTTWTIFSIGFIINRVMASTINETMNIINKSVNNFLKNILNSFFLLLPLILEPEVSIESPIPHFYK